MPSSDSDPAAEEIVLYDDGTGTYVETAEPASSSFQDAFPGMKTKGPGTIEHVIKPAVPKVPRTSAGDSTQDIVGRWCGWYYANTGIRIPQAIVGRISKQVKSLVVSSTTTKDITHVLAIWTLEAAANERCTPEQLPSIAFKYLNTTSARAAAWRKDCNAKITAWAKVTGVAAPNETKTGARQRVASTAVSELQRQRDQKAGW